MGLLDLLNKPYEEITAKALSDSWPHPTATLIDVRTPGEWNRGHVEGAIHLNFMGPDFKQKLESLDTDGTYYVLCRSGNRSRSAASLMTRMGFRHVINVRGGIVGWNGPLVD